METLNKIQAFTKAYYSSRGNLRTNSRLTKESLFYFLYDLLEISEYRIVQSDFKDGADEYHEDYGDIFMTVISFDISSRHHEAKLYFKVVSQQDIVFEDFVVDYWLEDLN